MPRTIAISDIHGCSDALASLLRAIDPKQNDVLITLGDYVDKGHDSKGVLDMLIGLSKRCKLVPILGNHDEMMLRAGSIPSALNWWMEFGAITTLDSYDSSGDIRAVPDEHFRFLEGCVPYYETHTHFFTHANYDPALPLDQQDGLSLRWRSLRDFMPGPHVSGKNAVLGHTPQADVLNLGHLICLDTGCAYGGKLTALDIESGEVWHAMTKQS